MHGTGTCVTVCDASVTATKRPRCNAMLEHCCLCIAQNDTTGLETKMGGLLDGGSSK